MEFFSSASSSNSSIESSQPSILNGLPDDIALSCLARVPRKYHAVLKCVSKTWRDLVCSEEWHSYRQENKLGETWIYALCRDKNERVCCYVLDLTSSRRCWKLMKELPSRCLRRKGMGFEVLGTKIYLLGGCSWSEDATDEVYFYDALKDSWAESAPLPSPRCYFACEAIDEKIHTIGGLGSDASAPQSWDSYDQSKNKWESHIDPNMVPDPEGSVVMDGKIYIKCSTSPVTSHDYAIVYQPSTATWQYTDGNIVSGWRGPAVVVNGTLYVLDQGLGTRVMMWEKESSEWVPLGRLSSLRTRPPCQVVSVGVRIVVVGKGLSTVIFDVENVGNVEGVIVSSSIPQLASNEDVISCRCLSI